MVKEGLVTGVELNSDLKPNFCKACVKAKVAWKPFPKESQMKYSSYSDKVVADVWGPAQVKLLGEKSYFVLYQDLSSHKERVYFMVKNLESFSNHKKYEAWIKMQRNTLGIKIFGCNRGGEFMSNEFTDHLKKAGKIHHLTIHDSLASNSTTEHSNHTLLKCTQAMMAGAGLPQNLWAEAVLHAVWVCKHIPTQALPECKMPLEVVTGQKPNLSKLVEWGAKVWIK